MGIDTHHVVRPLYMVKAPSNPLTKIVFHKERDNFVPNRKICVFYGICLDLLECLDI